MSHNLTDQRIAVIGLARSGIAVIKLLKRFGAKYIIGSDTKQKEQLSSEILDLEKDGIEIEAGGHTDKVINGIDTVIVSPGVPYNIPILEKARECGIPILSELEIAYNFVKANYPSVKIVAITGTAGKTTTTTLIGEILKNASIDVIVAGNIGTPLSQEILKISERLNPSLQTIVIEVSSFQLSTTISFKPDIALITNLSPNHLNWHKDVDEYYSMKMRIFANQDENDYVIFNLDNDELSNRVKPAKSKRIGFGIYKSQRYSEDAFLLDNDKVIYNGEILGSLKDMILPGMHNRYNALASISASMILGISKDKIFETIINFKGVEHRLEKVRYMRGITFYNDSKSTTLDSLAVALNSFDREVILIAGGSDKGFSFAPMRDIVKGKVKHLILIGETKKKIKEAVGGVVPITEAGSMAEAVRTAFHLANANDTVLLSPACASFDMFKDYEDRGNKFKEEVNRLIE